MVALGAFTTLYVLALMIRLVFSPADTLIYLGIDIGLGSLILLTWWLGRKRHDPELAISQPFLELAIGLLLYHALWRAVPNIPIEAWKLGSFSRRT